MDYKKIYESNLKEDISESETELFCRSMIMDLY